MYPYIGEDGAMNVEAIEMFGLSVSYKCPCCIRRKRNITHTHGNCGEYHNRILNRAHHGNEGYGMVNIHITDNTKREKKARGKM